MRWIARRKKSVEESWCGWGVSRLIWCGVLGRTNKAKAFPAALQDPPPSIGPKRHVITPFTQTRQAQGDLLRVKLTFDQPLHQSIHPISRPWEMVRAHLEDSDIEVYGLTGPALHQTEHQASTGLIIITWYCIIISKLRNLHANLFWAVFYQIFNTVVQPHRDDSQLASVSMSGETIPSVLMNHVSTFEEVVSFNCCRAGDASSFALLSTSMVEWLVELHQVC